MKRKQTTALILAALITASMAGCQAGSAQTAPQVTAGATEQTDVLESTSEAVTELTTLAETVSETQAGSEAETTIETTSVSGTDSVSTEETLEKPERKPIPEGGWTYETLSECVWIDGKYVSFPLDVSDFSSDFTFEPFYTSDDGTIIDVEVYHKEEYVGSARIVDKSGSGNMKNGHIQSAIFCDSCPIYINGLTLGDNVPLVDTYFAVRGEIPIAKIDLSDDSLIIRIVYDDKENIDSIIISEEV